MAHILDLRDEKKLIFCDDQLLPLKGVAMVEQTDDTISPLITYPIVGDDFTVVGENYYESIYPPVGFREYIWGRAGDKVSVRSNQLLNALNTAMAIGDDFNVGKILTDARGYGLEVVKDFEDDYLRLYASKTSVEGIYHIASPRDFMDLQPSNFPIPDIYLTLGEYGFDDTLKKRVLDAGQVKVLLRKAAAQYAQFFGIKHLNVHFHFSQDMDKIGKSALGKLKNNINYRPKNIWEE